MLHTAPPPSWPQPAPATQSCCSLQLPFSSIPFCWFSAHLSSRTRLSIYMLKQNAFLFEKLWLWPAVSWATSILPAKNSFSNDINGNFWFVSQGKCLMRTLIRVLVPHCTARVSKDTSERYCWWHSEQVTRKYSYHSTYLNQSVLKMLYLGRTEALIWIFPRIKRKF